MDRARCGRTLYIEISLVFLLLALGCSGDRSGLKSVPVVFGDTPANDANVLVGTWQATDFHITSSGTISGRLEVQVDRPEMFSVYHEILFVQVLAVYIWPQYGDTMVKPAGEFIPLFASHSTETSATFDLDGRFEVPQAQIDVDGGMPLHALRIRAIWYRVSDGLGYLAIKFGYPGDPERAWRGQMLMDRPSTSLRGTLGTNVPGQLPYPQWLKENLARPTAVPTTEPSLMSPLTPTILTSPLNP